MMPTSALTGRVPAAAPAAAAPPAAAGAVNDNAAPDEVLTVAELLRLLEQGEGFDQALAHAAAPVDSAAAASAGGAQRAGDDADDDADTPCDIATLLRLLEQPPAPAALATAAGAAAADALARGAAPAATSSIMTGDDDPVAPRPSAAVGGGTGAHGALAATPAATASGDAAANLLEAAIAGMTDASGTAGREAAREHAPPPSATPLAAVTDPAQATLDLVQGLRPTAFASAPVERAVHVAVRDPAWPQAVAAEIRFLADQKIEAATLRLSPEHLGPLEVRIDVRDGNVSVAFGVTHADTQAALQQALPRLREMLAAAGLQLGQASVQQEARRGSHNGGGAPAGGGSPADNGAGAAPVAVRALGLVDDYA